MRNVFIDVYRAWLAYIYNLPVEKLQNLYYFENNSLLTVENNFMHQQVS